MALLASRHFSIDLATCLLPRLLVLQSVTIIANGMQALTFVPEGNKELTDMFARWSIAYSKVLMCHLREDGDVQKTMEVSTANIGLVVVHASISRHILELPHITFLIYASATTW